MTGLKLYRKRSSADEANELLAVDESFRFGRSLIEFLRDISVSLQGLKSFDLIVVDRRRERSKKLISKSKQVETECSDMVARVSMLLLMKQPNEFHCTSDNN